MDLERLAVIMLRYALKNSRRRGSAADDQARRGVPNAPGWRMSPKPVSRFCEKSAHHR
jgi:hypothetical protein